MERLGGVKAGRGQGGRRKEEASNELETSLKRP
jgi:hypothetical protein